MISDCKKGKDGHSKAVKEDVTATITRLPCLGGYDLNTKSNAAYSLTGCLMATREQGRASTRVGGTPCTYGQ